MRCPAEVGLPIRNERKDGKEREGMATAARECVKLLTGCDGWVAYVCACVRADDVGGITVFGRTVACSSQHACKACMCMAYYWGIPGHPAQPNPIQRSPIQSSPSHTVATQGRGTEDRVLVLAAALILLSFNTTYLSRTPAWVSRTGDSVLLRC